MGDFVMVILVFICITQPVKPVAPVKPLYFDCLDKWRVAREPRMSAFLTDQSLVEEICIYGTSVEDMDNCMRRTVDESQHNILAWWDGLRDRFYKICHHVEDFIRYRDCRTNQAVVSAFDNCPTKYLELDCKSYQQLKACLKSPIHSQCKGEAAAYFSTLVDTEFAPVMTYMECPQETPKLSRLSIQRLTTTQRPKSTKTRQKSNVQDQRQQRHGNDHSQHRNREDRRQQRNREDKHTQKYANDQRQQRNGKDQRQQRHGDVRRQQRYEEDTVLENMEEGQFFMETEVFEEDITFTSAAPRTVYSVNMYEMCTYVVMAVWWLS